MLKLVHALAPWRPRAALADDERQLIRSAQKGDEAAFAKLVDTYYQRIYRFAYRWCGEQSDAQDITQQACIKLAQSLKQYRFEAAFSTWLYRLVINCARDWWRAEHRHRTEAVPADEQAGHGDTGENEVFLAQVLQHLEHLPAGFKETALLVHAEGLSHAQAAFALEIKESTVSWRLHAIRKQLAHLFPGEEAL